MATLKNIELTDTDEKLLGDIIHADDGHPIKGDLFLDVENGYARFKNNEYDLEFNDISITLNKITTNGKVYAVILSETGNGEWIFESVGESDNG